MRKRGALRKPEKMPLAYDSSNLAKNAADHFTSLPAPSRHPQNVVLFADGHAKGRRTGSRHASKRLTSTRVSPEGFHTI